MVEKKRGEDASSSSTTNKLLLKKAAYKRIESIKKKAFISEREIYDLVRGFFKKHLEIDYEFTQEELLKELKRIYISPELQDKVNSLFTHIAEIEHSSKTFSREELEAVLDEFGAVVDGLIVSHYQKEKSFIKKFLDRIAKSFSRKHETLLVNDKAILSENERHIVKMNMLLDNAKRWSNTDLEKAKEAYKELNSIYNSLDDAKKKAYYRPVSELYSMLQAAEKN